LNNSDITLVVLSLNLGWLHW